MLCSSVLLETANYFTTGNTDVYECLSDASKAFERVNFGNLFILLLERNMPAIIVRYVLDCYTRQLLLYTGMDVALRYLT